MIVYLLYMKRVDRKRAAFPFNGKEIFDENTCCMIPENPSVTGGMKLYISATNGQPLLLCVKSAFLCTFSTNFSLNYCELIISLQTLSKISKRVSILFKLSEYLPMATIKTLYYSLINPFIRYEIEVWHCTYANTYAWSLAHMLTLLLKYSSCRKRPEGPSIICLSILTQTNTLKIQKIWNCPFSMLKLLPKIIGAIIIFKYVCYYFTLWYL